MTSERAPRRGSVEHWTALTPDRVALCEGKRTLTWAQWNAASNRVAQVLATRARVQPGDRVAVCMQNRLEWFVSQIAISKLGAELVPISYRLTPAEIHYIVADCQARALLFDAEDVDAMARVWSDGGLALSALSVMRTARTDVLSFAEVSEHGELVERIASAAPRSIVYTSGTTGRPRGVVQEATTPPKPREQSSKPPQEARSQEGRPQENRPAVRPETGAPERNLLGAPLNHAAGQASARVTLGMGGTVYIMPRFEPEEALRIIEREKITSSFLVPTMLNRIMKLPSDLLSKYDVSSIKVITTGASPCPQALKEQVIAYFGAHCLYESYGSTEVGLVSRMLPADHLKKPGSCGRLLDGVEAKIVDAEGQLVPEGGIGEILVKTPMMIARYLNQGAPEELKDGFFASGDVGRFDEDGYLYILDRKKDMIIAGGVNIYPAEIEAALREHPAVLDAAVFGIPHPEWGEEVKGAVELIEGQTLTQDALLDFVRDKLAAYKRPRTIDFMAELPRNPAGKVLKAQMRAPYWQASEKPI